MNQKPELSDIEEEDDDDDDENDVFNLQSFIMGDVLGINDHSSSNCKDDLEYNTPRQTVYTFFEVPRQLERVINKLHIFIYKNFINIFIIAYSIWNMDMP